jgi:glycosyltransferase involved in cell wall biosynthesis
MEGESKLTIVIPAYNEASSLPGVLTELIPLSAVKNWNIIVVDDGSSDGTMESVIHFKDSGILEILRHKLNKGYGAAIKTGIRACKTEYVITIDGDGQHSLPDIEHLFEVIQAHDADMVVGSRKGQRNASILRGIGKKIIRDVAKMLMTVPIYDLNSGMKIYRTELAQKYLHLAPNTMSYSDIITLVFINNRHLVMEEPISINARKDGKSTIGIETAFQTVMEIVNILILFNPMKVFLPISIISFVLSLGWGLPLVFQGRGVSTGSLLGLISALIFFLLGLIAEQLSLIRRNQRE